MSGEGVRSRREPPCRRCGRAACICPEGRLYRQADPECERLTGRLCNACLCNAEVPGFVSGCRALSLADEMAAHLKAQSDYYRDHPRVEARPTTCRDCDGDGTTWACELGLDQHDPWDALGCDTQVPCPACNATGVIEP